MYQGGAIAMHMDDMWVAVVRRQVFEVYVFQYDHCILWKAVALPHIVGSAAFSYVTCHCSPPSLRLCITCTWGLFVYDVRCNIEEGRFSLDLLWHHDPPECDDFDLIASRGVLGVTGKSVSWIQGDDSDHAYPVSFATTKIPSDINTEPSIFEWYNEKTPALYSMGVFDFDEARGILALGNAFGELSLLDFSDSEPHQLSKCLELPIEPVPYMKQELLPIASRSSFFGV